MVLEVTVTFTASVVVVAATEAVELRFVVGSGTSAASASAVCGMLSMTGAVAGAASSAIHKSKGSKRFHSK